MGFRRGDQVEVASKEEGFLGSYYAATVIAEVLEKEYIVQYKTLLKDDRSGPLREIVTAGEVRPRPPQIPATSFGLYEKVDAFDNDGWWVGNIAGKVGLEYLVNFETTWDQIAYPMSRLRVHQEWVNGKWVEGSSGMGEWKVGFYR
ncbi:protein AGENET DOMAIN (AGD)-CONTAINING P1-like [Cornus florida]|uniref:protein AGENET DOMAIN (AGD)-CONTAINING P1-like n=1 Tax=Cornus florida TaxID=4283 RepID=UPI0028964903|nr:protein AGENET DOMAIN (AGD)-CONTAINING P1-like [Cornus florida]